MKEQMIKLDQWNEQSNNQQYKLHDSEWQLLSDDKWWNELYIFTDNAMQFWSSEGLEPFLYKCQYFSLTSLIQLGNTVQCMLVVTVANWQ